MRESRSEERLIHTANKPQPGLNTVLSILHKGTLNPARNPRSSDDENPLYGGGSDV